MAHHAPHSSNGAVVVLVVVDWVFISVELGTTQSVRLLRPVPSYCWALSICRL